MAEVPAIRKPSRRRSFIDLALGTAPYFWYTQPTIMEPGAVFSHLVRFGLFELDLQTAELSKNGRKLKLQEQPFRLLALLLEHPGEVVTREQLKIALWPEDTFVDFEHSLNAAVAKLRQTLGDSAENPRFIATVPRRGYRFIAPVEGVDPVPRLSRDNTTAPAVVIGKDQPRPGDRWSRRFTLLVVSGVAMAIIAGVAILFLQTTRQHGRAPYTVMRRLTADDGLTTDPAVSPDGTLLAYASDRGGKGRLNLWVQQLSGGSTIRLTNSDADDRQPSFSPDGTQIVFRSERQGGGLYVVPTLGGETRFIAKDGRDPHFSPDGKWIAYWVGNITDDSLNTGEVFVIPSSGGVPQVLKTDMHLGYPLWSPDGEHLLVLAATTYGAEKDLDWWVFARDGHRNVRTGAFRLLEKQGFPLTQTSGGYPPRVMQWVGNNLLFSARFGDSTDIWVMHLSPRSWQVEGTARRLTSGPAIEDHPQLLPDGRIVFTDLARSSNLWALSIDANEGKPRTDVLQQITYKVSLEQFGSISGDGRYLVFTSTRSTGQAHVWLKDLSTGRESRLNRTEEEEEHPVISHDGTLVAYSDQHGVSVVPRLAHGAPESLCEKCGWVWDWSPDHQTFLYNDRQPIWGIRSFDLRTRKKSLVLASSKGPLYQARLSPDGKWLVFGQAVHYSTSHLFITPLQNGVAGPESEWIPIADASGWCDKPRWSLDGNLIYFISNRDGYRCLWAQRVARHTKRPIGEPFSVMHFHSARLSMMNIGTAFLEVDVAKDKMVFNLGELTGNIWLASDK